MWKKTQCSTSSSQCEREEVEQELGGIKTGKASGSSDVSIELICASAEIIIHLCLRCDREILMDLE